jgi:hypothetical protein
MSRSANNELEFDLDDRMQRLVRRGVSSKNRRYVLTGKSKGKMDFGYQLLEELKLNLNNDGKQRRARNQKSTWS